MREIKMGKSHSFDLIFVLGLFGIFAVSAVVVMLIGISVYRDTVSNLNNHFSNRTASAYVTQKIRQNNSDGRVAAGEIEGLPAVVIAGEGTAANTTTYIYCYDGQLMELYIRNGTDANPQSGQEITEIKSLNVEDAGNNILRLTIVDSSGNTEVSCIRLCPAAGR